MKPGSKKGAGSGEIHAPVLPEEVLSFARSAFEAGAPPLILDATLGEAGHTRLLLQHFPGAAVIGVDRDPEMIGRAATFCRQVGVLVSPWAAGPAQPGQLHTIRAPFSQAPETLAAADVRFGFILLDLGVSMYHFRSAARGFSFGDDALDMRLDPDLEESAADVVNQSSEQELAALFSELGQERFARRIAHRIVENRPIRDAAGLAALVVAAVPRHAGARIHPATRVFQALRIQVNDELGELDRALAQLPDLLARSGVLCVISFHSLEDRAVKRAFRSLSGRPLDGGERTVSNYTILTRRPLIPGEAEARDNPSARSAKLRALQRGGVDTATRGRPGSGNS